MVDSNTGPAVPANVPPPREQLSQKILKSKTFGSVEEIPIVVEENAKREPKGTSAQNKRDENVKKLLGQAYKVAKQPARVNKNIITEIFTQSKRGAHNFDIGGVSLKRMQNRAQREADDYIMDQGIACGINLAGMLA